MTGHRTHKISKVMTTLSDMVMQCGGGGCCVLEQCFQYPRRAREPRDCGCQFALLHRADIAWPSVLANNLYFYYCLFFFFLFFLLLPLRPLSTSSSSSSSLRISCLSLSLSLTRSPPNTVAMCLSCFCFYDVCFTLDLARLFFIHRLSPLFVELSDRRFYRSSVDEYLRR